MKNRTTLTKSLHTVSAVTRVAMQLNHTMPATPELLTYDALRVLGLAAFADDAIMHDTPTDPTVARCVAAVRAELARAVA